MKLGDGTSYEFGLFRLDVAEHTLLRDGRPVQLTPKVFDVLCVLVQHSGHLVEKETLLREVWPDCFIEEANLNRSISVLRKALGETAAGSTFIETVPKRGYRFTATVKVVGNHIDSMVKPEGPALSSVLIPELAPRNETVRISRRISGPVFVVGALTLSLLLYGWIRGSQGSKPSSAVPFHHQVTFTGKEGSPTLSPDGQLLAYVSTERPERQVMVQKVAGGRPISAFSAPEAGLMRWSPDGSELMFFARGGGKDGIFVVPQLGGDPRKIASGGQFVACWSPDGRMIAVARFQVGKISILSSQGQHIKTISLEGVQRWISDIDWSRANGSILFVSNDTRGQPGVWTIKPDGSNQKRILTEDGEISAARWAPRGNAIYYLRRFGRTTSLHKVALILDERESQTAASPLLTGLETDGSFAISADGKQLAYARAPYYSNLWMVEPRGSGANQKPETRQLTHGTSQVERPRFSPDGRSVVFNMGHQRGTDLYTIPIAGGEPKQLTFMNSFSVNGFFAPDGKRIAFASTQGGASRVWIVSADGGPAYPVSSGQMSDSFDVAWLPRLGILYQQTGNQNYYELDPNTHEERHLLADSSRGWIFSPIYSPAGKLAVAWSRRDGNLSGIWIVNTNPYSERRIYDTPLLPIGWSSDGTSIFVVRAKRAAYRDVSVNLGETITEATVLAVPLNGGNPTPVVSLPFEEIGGLSVTPDGRRFICAVYSSRSDVWTVENFDPESNPPAHWATELENALSATWRALRAFAGKLHTSEG